MYDQGSEVLSHLGRKLGVQRDQNNTNNMIKLIEYLVLEVKKGSGLEKGYKMAWHFLKLLGILLNTSQRTSFILSSNCFI